MAEPLTLYKLIILYMLDKVNFPLTNSQISEFILDKGYTTYFHIQEAINQLIDSELLEMSTVRNSSRYRITPKGEETIHYFQNEISPEIQEEIIEFFNFHAYELRNEVSTIADYYKKNADEYEVRCQVIERQSYLIDMTLTVPTKEAATTICSRWQEKSQEIYAHIMGELL